MAGDDDDDARLFFLLYFKKRKKEMGTLATWTRYSTNTGERYIKSVIKDDDDGCVMAAASGTHSNSRARARLLSREKKVRKAEGKIRKRDALISGFCWLARFYGHFFSPLYFL